MPISTIIILSVLAIAMVAFFVLYFLFHEFEKTFLWATYGFVVFILGFAVYLSLTTPSFSFDSPKPRTAGVTIDASNLLQE